MGNETGLASGTLLDGRYRVGSPIARGGMSTVYRGLDLRLDRAVAIKVMSPAYAADPAFLARFEREARLSAGLAHPGVVGVHDFGRDGDRVYLVMELVDGGTLRDLLRQRAPLDPATTVAVLRPLLAALAAAHAAGLVHRDVKPENVLISSTGTVKIADFGLVRPLHSATLATGDVILGTVAYLAPEQVETGAADPRTDVYAAGIVAWEMLTGHPPYGGDTPMAVAYAHVHRDVPPPSTEPAGTQVPATLDRLIVAATRRDPAARPRDAAAFLRQLIAAADADGLPTVVVPAPRRSAPPPAPAPSDAGTPDPATSADDGTRVLHGPRPTPPAGATRPGHATVVGAPDRSLPDPVDETGADDSPLPVSRRRRVWAIALIAALVLGMIAAAGGWWFSGRWSAAPTVVGLTQSAAENAVRDAGLTPRVVNRHDDAVPSGQIAASAPTAGDRVLTGSEVELDVSLGRPVVPDVAAGTPVDIATAAVSGADLTPRTGSPAFDDTAPAGTVLRTDPTSGTTLTVGADVTLVLSAGPAPVDVPEIAGDSETDAAATLVSAGLRTGTVTRRFDADVEAGTVLDSTPAPGDRAPRGSAVDLVVAQSLTVPTLRGTAVDTARTALERDGWTVTVGTPVFDAGVNGGSVVRSDLPAGTRVDPQAAAIFLVPSNAVQVPDLDGRSVADARRIVQQLGLQFEDTTFFGGEGATVFSQSPNAGGRVPPGGTVSVAAT
ncbi:Stk1 family PASTA domain-containing Ser/Thr kinase [Nakamurella flava]|uniref:non-specific serine/threonine protein kinase n=1 Tax=Nakamurella flava TaxID=2576308 RepID=A0A4U6QK40_9ACTN|nr:Stk1 family PASTA domain-containing Ser/Thr kinase [Nakamurella flava]TKV60472.1 Stk1 family PASTA domain-containing Ser/Thr kinase [Nakamurella flava]